MGGKTSQLVSLYTTADLKLCCITHLILKEKHKPPQTKKNTQQQNPTLWILKHASKF